MPYHPFDTGWIKSIYSMVCLGWFLLSTGLLPRLYSIYNNIYIPVSEFIIHLCEFTGACAISAGNNLVQVESIVFSHIDYVAPCYKCMQCIESLFTGININIGPPKYYYTPSNTRTRKTSAGKHLGSHFAHAVSDDNKLLSQVRTNRRMIINLKINLLSLTTQNQLFIL
jgi:hypothetical protein